MKPAEHRQRTLWRLFGFLKPWRSIYFASLLGLAMVLTAERMLVAYVIKLFVDAITGAKLDLLWYSVELWLAFLAVWVPLTLILTYLWRSVTVRAITNLRQTIFGHLQRLPLGYHEQRHSGDLLSVLTNDVTVTEQAFQQDMLNLVNASLQGISAAAFMLVLNWQLALVVIASGMIPLPINALFANPLRKAGEAVQDRLGGMSQRLTDLLAGYQVVRTYTLGEWIMARFSKANRELLDSGMRRMRLESALAGANVLGGVAFVLPLGIGAYMVLTGQTTFGILVALTQLGNQILFFVYSLGGTITRIQASLAAADRILAVLDAKPEPECYGEDGSVVVSMPDSNALLEFRDVSFAYGDGKEALQGMSFRVRQGQVAAFVGPSGGGKSTIFKLLLGGYPVRDGAVFVSRRSTNTYGLSELRDQFAYIPQDAYLYAGTILENICYGKPGATQEEVIAAARAAYAHDFICEFPDGYETKVGERGARLSGGQRQRIAIARALLKDTPVLLLDEATSALDSESEELVQRALEVLMRGRTVLIIAHRLSTIEHADVIFAVDGGRVVEAGTHDELLRLDGLFRRLHDLQFHEEGLGGCTETVLPI
ncbi:MAG: ABC transporter ATP-binding protein/permease [Chloroflexi bacterium]|nr:ABC transporter ATP-binding protein/permease [Chloroflexota bacterium]